MTEHTNPTPEEVDYAMQIICESLMPLARLRARGNGKPLINAFSYYLRPLVKRALYGQEAAASPIDVSGDQRERAWLVNTKFWDTSMGMERGELLAESDEEVVEGLRNVGQVVLDYAEMVHGEDNMKHITGLTPLDMERKIRTVRTLISRNGGSGIMRIYYKIGTEEAYYCTVNIMRYDKPFDT